MYFGQLLSNDEYKFVFSRLNEPYYLAPVHIYGFVLFAAFTGVYLYVVLMVNAVTTPLVICCI